MANPNPHQARTAKKQKALETPSIKGAALIVWQALQTAQTHLENDDPSQSLKAVHAIGQSALAFAKLHEVSELEARIDALESFAEKREQNEALKSDDLVKQMQLQGMEPLGGTPDQFARRIKADTAQWDAVLQASGLGK